MSNDEPEDTEIRQVRREGRLRKRRGQMKKHGGSLVRIYQNAVIKRLKRSRRGQ